MTAGLAVVFALTAVLAFANGANDVSKGVATLVGSGVTDYRRALGWGAVCTVIGALLGAYVATAMLHTFGQGLLSPAIAPSFSAAIAVLVGASAWVLLATRFGLPVSTTHALVGALSGVFAVAFGVRAIQWTALTGKVVVPLLVSPLVSFVLTRASLKWSARFRVGTGAGHDCVCLEVAPDAIAFAGDGVAGRVQSGRRLNVVTGRAAECAAQQPAAAVTLDRAHWLSSAGTSVARGMNDAPKIVALAVAASVLAPQGRIPTGTLFLLVACAMLIGSAWAGRRVASVLAERVTVMDHGDGFVANGITSVLVATGALFGLPMSTTHVASAAIAASGAERGTLNRAVARDILLAWVVTLPAAAGLGVGAYVAIRALGS